MGRWKHPTRSFSENQFRQHNIAADTEYKLINYRLGFLKIIFKSLAASTALFLRWFSSVHPARGTSVHGAVVFQRVAAQTLWS
jgi:hypothetical protein